MDSQPYTERLEKCSHLMEAEGIDVLLLTSPANMLYLTGNMLYPGVRPCAFAMVTQRGEVALGVPKTDIEDFKEIALFDHVMGFEGEIDMVHTVSYYFRHFGISRGTVGLEYTYLTQSMVSVLTHSHAKPQEVYTKDCTPVMSGLRIVKEEVEIEAIQEASRVADVGMWAAVEALRPGMTESQAAAEAEHAMRYAGADGFYSTCVLSGPRTRISRGLPTQRKLQPGDLVMIDIHPVVSGYSANICRTVCVGEPTGEQQAAYSAFLRAQQATVAEIKAGAGVAGLEETLRGVLREAGYEKYIFGAPVHGVGIEPEEPPLPPGHAFLYGEPPPLEANMVISVGDCGIYLGDFGVRVEDTVAVTEYGPRILTTYPCRLKE